MGKPRKYSRSGSSWDAAQTHRAGSRPESNPAPDDQSSDVEKPANDMSSDIYSDAEDTQNSASIRSEDRARDDFGTSHAQTCCSNCQTIFEVSVELLSSTDTRVRCGECLSIFDALANLRDDELEDENNLVDASGNIVDSGALTNPVKRHVADRHAEAEIYHEASSLPDAGAAALAGLTNDTNSLDVTYSDFDLFSDEANLPEVTYFDQTRDTPNFDFDELGEAEETFSDTLFAQDITQDAGVGRTSRAGTGAPDIEEAHDLNNIALSSEVDYITDDSPREPLIFKYRERELASSSNDSSTDIPLRPEVHVDENLDGDVDRDKNNSNDHRISVPDDNSSPWLLRSAMFLLVMFLAVGLYIYRERESVYTNRFIRPVVEAACSVVNCVLPERTDLSAIKVLKRAVFSHPTIKNALIIDLAIMNEATFSQRYPVLEIRLTDRSGRLVVRNNFLPADYLDTWREDDELDVGKRLDISLTVEDPGQTATSFELDFR